MSEGLRAEDVKEGLDEAEDAVTYQAEVLASEHPWPTVVAAARAWLASQEQTPDYEAAAERLEELDLKVMTRRGVAKAIVDAALVGFHPQPDCDLPDPRSPTRRSREMSEERAMKKEPRKPGGESDMKPHPIYCDMSVVCGYGCCSLCSVCGGGTWQIPHLGTLEVPT